jgi:hypothetical protein
MMMTPTLEEILDLGAGGSCARTCDATPNNNAAVNASIRLMFFIISVLP